MRKTSTIQKTTVRTKNSEAGPIPGIENRHLIFTGKPAIGKTLAALAQAYRHIQVSQGRKLHVVSAETSRTQLLSFVRDTTSENPLRREVASLAAHTKQTPTLTHLPDTQDWYLKVDPQNFEVGTVVVLDRPVWGSSDSQRLFYEELPAGVLVIEVMDTWTPPSPCVTNQRVVVLTPTPDGDVAYQLQ